MRFNARLEHLTEKGWGKERVTSPMNRPPRLWHCSIVWMSVCCCSVPCDAFPHSLRNSLKPGTAATTSLRMHVHSSPSSSACWIGGVPAITSRGLGCDCSAYPIGAHTPALRKGLNLLSPFLRAGAGVGAPFLKAERCQVRSGAWSHGRLQIEPPTDLKT